MKYVKKIIFFLSFFLLYFILKEMLELFALASSVDPWLGYILLVVILAFLIYFVVIPVFRIISIPVAYAPVNDKLKVPALIEKRLERFQNNKHLIEQGIVRDINKTGEENYQEAVSSLKIRCKEIRRKYLTQLFYGTAISQNGFLDALIMLNTSVNMVKEIFILYNGRVSNRDLLTIAKKVYYAVLITGSEGIERATDEIFSKFASDTIKSIPFIDKIIGSLMDGFISAALITRVALITENYCTMLLLKSDRELFPSYRIVVSSANEVTSGILDGVSKKLILLSKEKGGDIFKKVVNPVTLVFDKSKEFLIPSGDEGFLKKLANKLF